MGMMSLEAPSGNLSRLVRKKNVDMEMEGTIQRKIDFQLNKVQHCSHYKTIHCSHALLTDMLVLKIIICFADTRYFNNRC